MLDHLTIQTEDKDTLRPLLTSAIDQEKKMLALGIERTRKHLAEFEQQYQMTTAEFERRLNSNQLEETLAFTDWRMELGILRRLERQYQALENARLD